MDNECILTKLFPGRIIIPKEVYDELSHPGVNRIKGLKKQVDMLIQNNEVSIETIDVGSAEYEMYKKLTKQPDQNHKIIGRGEAASISLAKARNGIVASNNLKDIMVYVEEYKLSFITTGDIVKMAYDFGYIDEDQGNTIWAAMLSKRRKLGYPTFSKYLEEHQDNL